MILSELQQQILDMTRSFARERLAPAVEGPRLTVPARRS
jgi:hypothetical protein